MAANIFVFGAHGHAKVVIDVLEQMEGVKVAFVIDDAERAHAEQICGYTAITGCHALLRSGIRTFAPGLRLGLRNSEFLPPAPIIREP